MQPTPASGLTGLIADHFEGTYYDGQSSKPHLAWIWLRPNGLRICKRVDDGLVDEVIWEPKGILKDEFSTDELVLLRYDSNPPTKLEVKGQQFLRELEEAYPTARFLQNPYRFALTKGWGAKLALVAGASAVLWFLFTLAVPFFSTQLANQTPAAVEETVGQNAFAELQPILTLNENRSTELQVFFDELYPEDGGETKLFVADSEIKNAFALPGHIVVFSGLLNDITTEEQLAGLLAHEYGHIQRNHSLRMLYNQASIWFIVGALLGDPTAGSNYVTANAGNLLNLDYSRGMEREADTYAIASLQEKGLSTEGMAQLFELLQRESEGGIEVPKLLQSHPGLEERIEGARAAATNPAEGPSEALQSAFAALKASAPAPTDNATESESPNGTSATDAPTTE